MPHEIGVGYVTLLPSARGMSKNVEREMAGVWSRTEKAGSSAFSAVFSKVTKWAAAASVAVAGYFSAKKIFGGGLGRLLNIEDAQAKLRGLGHDAEAVAQIMTDALAAVKGTAFGLDTAATVAASAVAAGIEPGKELERYLRLTADAATIAGTSMDEMGSIFNKVQSQGRAYSEELNQLADRGIPIYQWLAREFGVTAEAMRDMVARGEIDSETYRRVIEKNIAGAALESGNTTRGALANLGAALNRIGANLLSGIFPMFKEAIMGITKLLGPVEEAALRLGEALGEKLRSAIDRVRDALTTAKGVFDAAGGGMAGLAATLQTGMAGLLNWLGGGGLKAILDRLLASRTAFIEAFANLLPVILNAMIATVPQIASWVTGSLIPQLVQVVSVLVPEIVAAVMQAVPAVIRGLLGAIPSLLAAARQLFASLVEAVIDIVPDLVQAVVDLVPPVVDAIMEMLPQIVQAGIDLFMGLIDGLIKVIPILVGAIVDMLPTLVNALMTLLPDIIQAGIDLFMGLIRALSKVLPDLISAVVEMIPEIVDALVSMLPDIIDGAIQLFTGLIEGLADVLPELIAAVVNMIPVIVDALVGNLPVIIEGAITLFLGLIDGLIRALPQILDAIFTKLIPGMVKALIDAIPKFVEAGKRLMEGFFEGLKQGWKSIPGWFIDKLTWLTTLFPYSPAKHGPLRKRPPAVAGANIMSELLSGMKSKMPELDRMMMDVTATMVPEPGLSRGSDSWAVDLTVNMTDLEQLKTFDDFMNMLRIYARQGVTV